LGTAPRFRIDEATDGASADRRREKHLRRFQNIVLYAAAMKGWSCGTPASGMAGLSSFPGRTIHLQRRNEMADTPGNESKSKTPPRYVFVSGAGDEKHQNEVNAQTNKGYKVISMTPGSGPNAGVVVLMETILS